jgi:cytochrome P450
LDQLREEAKEVLAEDNSIWTKKGLAKMFKTDSALRESQRIGSFLGVGLVRHVVCPGGITAPNGTFCPTGIKVSVAVNGIHNDPELYEEPSTFKPFRFSSERQGDDIQGLKTENTGVSAGVDSDTNEYIRRANLDFVSTSPEYQPVGHGKRACPGRFFAANELKLLLAYMVLNYEFKPMKRPESKGFGINLLPPLTETTHVRRKRQV